MTTSKINGCCIDRMNLPAEKSRWMHGRRKNRSVDELIAEEPVGTCNTRQHKEKPAAHRHDVLLERLALQPFLHRQETLLQAALVGDERQALVESACAVEPAGVVESSAQDEVLLGFGGA